MDKAVPGIAFLVVALFLRMFYFPIRKLKSPSMNLEL